MKKSNPFSRAVLLAHAIASLGATTAIAKYGDYVSRGHGRGGHSGKKWGPRPSYRDMHVVNGKWRQIENGARETARRRRQLANTTFVFDKNLKAYAAVL